MVICSYPKRKNSFFIAFIQCACIGIGAILPGIIGDVLCVAFRIYDLISVLSYSVISEEFAYYFAGFIR